MIRKIPHRFLFQILLVLFVLPTPTSATVTLTQTSSSGSDTLGSCAVSSSDPNCFSSISPETYEKCTFTSSTAGFLVFQSFDVASPSFIQLGKNEYTGAPNAHYLSADEPVKWSTSYSVDSTTGFEACIEVPNFVCSAGEGVAWGGSSLTCETCPAGTSADAEGKLPCLKCQSGKFTAGTGTQYCQSCPDGTEGGEGAEECYEWCHPTSDHCVNTMQKLFDKVSSESTYVQGDDIMDDGDTLTMAEGTFTCTVPGGTPFPCANGYRMLHITDLSGTINCATDAATCVLDGSNSKRIIDIWNGLSTGKLTFRALKFANGGQSLMKDAGGIYMGTGELDLIMCIFHNCHAYGSGIGGAIYVKAQTNWGDDPAVLNLYAVQFVGNVAPVGQGADIAIPASSVGVTVNIYSSECPSPYQSATIQQGEALDIYNPDSNVITSDDVDAEGTLASWSGCYFARFICPVGRYNPSLSAGSDISDVSECIDCQPGKSASTAGSVGSCMDCAVGTYAASSAMGTCTDCAQGKFGVNAAQSSESACFDCGRGKRGLVPGATSDSCVDCEAGTWSDLAVSSTCVSCEGGKYSDVVASASHSDCVDCSPGKYATPASSVCSICSFGKYSSSTSTSCTNCPAGKYIEDDSVTATLHANYDSCVNCPAGKASDESPDNLCDEICLPGTYSVVGSTACTSCERGKFNEQLMQPSCVACGVGRYNEDKGSVNEAACSLCSAGKASDEETRNSPCPECPEGTATAAIGMAACSSCPAGRFSNVVGSYQCDPCSPGSSSSNSGSISCTQCNPGSFTTATGSVSCEMCPAGQKMSVDGDGCDLCPDGKFSNTGSIVCTTCDATAGFISLAGEAGAAACEYCGPGFYADQTAHECKMCSEGKYSTGGVDSCIVCPSGNTGETRTSCPPCPPGTIVSDDRSSCSPCPRGKYAEFGAEACSMCAGLGQYSSTAGAAFCSTAGAGYFPATNREAVIECPQNSYSIGAVDSCKHCSPGAHSQKGASACEQCSSGRYYSEVNSACESCPRNTFSPSGASDITGCLPCEGGHSAPGAGYCEVCAAGKSYDESQDAACVSCDDSGGSVSLRVAVLMAIVSTLAGITYLMKRRAKKEEERLAREGRARSGESTYKRSKRKLKNGGKIIFSGAQISVSLPSVIPSFTMPENFKETLRTMRVFNMSTFEIFSMGCWTAGFNVYYQVLATTVPIIVICVLLLFMGLAISEHRQGLFTIAIAVTYLTLPTVTTMIFSLFPCDDLDDGQSYLRSDYSISCDGEERTGWVVFGLLMILVFPIGVTSAYWMLLWADREKIRRPIEVREQDEELMTKAFLFEPYKPEYWYFEVVETARRLMMTGVLSTIKPGSFVQLSSGLLMSIGYVVFISNIHPYVEVRDNTIAVLTGCQLVLVFMTASFMKYQTKLEEGEAYELQGLGVMLILSYLIIFVLFLFWAWHQKDEMSRSSTTFATKTIKKLGKKVVSKHSLRTVVSVRGKKMNSSDSGGVELSKRPFDGRVDEDQQVFAYENPMTQDLTTTIGGVSRGESFPISEEYEEEEEEEEDVKPPAIPMRVTSTGLLKLSKEADEGGGGDEDVIPGPPPLPVPEDHVEWSQMWDEEHKAPYWMNKDGVTSTWDRPLGY
ncbi:hypothetical protein TrST_g9108 [Triparma strigata]|uniref:WW domain-containing protein n=1 Tax=Triparma strigata TaxID=1606541 RepID=A0A9W7A074_9STRA|nr:hypothetical protein TrST_g9108 [Triparma strigata]